MKSLAAVVAAVAAAGVIGAGCNSSDPDEAKTPAGAETIVNTAIQTDAEGNTIGAPAGEKPPAEGGGKEPAAGGGKEPVAGGGDAKAGLATFQATCTGCHSNDGNAAGVGPKLTGAGLDAAKISATIENGAGGIMPANLVTGTDKDNVVAYVLSIQ